MKLMGGVIGVPTGTAGSEVDAYRLDRSSHHRLPRLALAHDGRTGDSEVTLGIDLTHDIIRLLLREPDVNQVARQHALEGGGGADTVDD